MNFLNSVSDAARSSAATDPSRIDDLRAPRRNLASEQSEQAPRALGLQNAETADIGDRLRQLRPVEEPHRAEVQEHPGVALAQQRDVERPATRGGVMEAESDCQGSSYPSRQALEDMDPALGEAAAQDDVEARDPARDPFDRPLGHVAALPGGLAADTGSATVNDDPCPGALSMLIVPPMAVTS